jgi:hypothetical protein
LMIASNFFMRRETPRPRGVGAADPMPPLSRGGRTGAGGAQ